MKRKKEGVQFLQSYIDPRVCVQEIVGTEKKGTEAFDDEKRRKVEVEHTLL